MKAKPSPEPGIPPRSTFWVRRCANYLSARRPEFSEEESLSAAEHLWVASHLALTPEQAADMVLQQNRL
ncbi:hypothetical protein [Aquabacterium sp.]|uniref:hypothetical protein n=1 Tax=Aquabacterium sp. TaxID=1872578 RepID=UPI003D6D83E1